MANLPRSICPRDESQVELETKNIIILINIRKLDRFCPDLNLQNGGHWSEFRSHSQNQKLTSTEGVL